MKLHFLQAIRAIAAWLVIIDHTLLEISRNDTQNSLTHAAWTFGSAGVYVFFVISGFIMVHICWESFGRPGARWHFLQRRIVRIVPLYWLATFAALVYHRVSVTHGAHAAWADLAYSLSFIPYSGDDGSWSPILPQGWTLNYEMLFYGVFTLSLSFPRRIGLAAVGAILGAFVIAGPYIANEHVAYLASPIVLWFVLGMGLAVLWRWRGLEEPKWLASSSKFLEPLGDASYSTYLVHGFTLTVLFRAWVMVSGAPSLWVLPIGIGVATLLGWLTHILVEVPLLRFTNNLWKHRAQASAALKIPGAGSR